MIKQHFQYSLSCNIVLTTSEIEHIVAIGKNHYDWACKDFATKISNIWPKFKPDGVWPKDEQHPICVEWNEFDTVSKILEMESHYNAWNKDCSIVLYESWVNLFKELSDENKRINAHWMILSDRFTASYRQDLINKYGDGKTLTFPR
jgi:hypothetical protein